MAAVTRPIAPRLISLSRWIAPLGLLGLLAVDGCTSAPPKQWYKPGGNYTTDQFMRDRTACTTDGNLDESCLQARGWIPLTGDVDTRTPMKGGPPDTGRERYAPK